LFGVNGGLFVSIADNGMMLAARQESIVALANNAMI
jgi:hypothetical protein